MKVTGDIKSESLLNRTQMGRLIRDLKSSSLTTLVNGTTDFFKDVNILTVFVCCG